MAIDTAAKRSSALDHEEVWQWGAPFPDGTIGPGDRQHCIWSYSGILAQAPPVFIGVSEWLTRVVYRFTSVNSYTDPVRGVARANQLTRGFSA